MCDDTHSIIFLSMLDIGLKETNKSCDPDVTNKLSFPLPMQYLGLVMIGLIKVFYSILFFSSAKHQEHNLLVNQAILIDHGASDAFDHVQYDLLI